MVKQLIARICERASIYNVALVLFVFCVYFFSLADMNTKKVAKREKEESEWKKQ